MVRIEDVTAERTKAKIHSQRVRDLAASVFADCSCENDGGGGIQVRDDQSVLVAYIHPSMDTMSLREKVYGNTAMEFARLYEKSFPNRFVKGCILRFCSPGSKKEFKIEADYSDSH